MAPEVGIETVQGPVKIAASQIAVSGKKSGLNWSVPATELDFGTLAPKSDTNR